MGSLLGFWRSGGDHIGWAPLPPETLAYGGQNWDSSVDVTFGIGALWFNFVAIRDFGGPIRSHCLPFAQNNGFYQNTVNVTNIYLQDRRVKGRIDTARIDRPEALRPEITEQFRRSREESRATAERSMKELGDRRTFDQRRIERLETNRRQAQEQSRANKPNRPASNSNNRRNKSANNKKPHASKASSPADKTMKTHGAVAGPDHLRASV